jgi:molybdate/tungstate transport system permease protein
MIKDKTFLFIFLFLASVIVLFLTIPLMKLFFSVGLSNIADTIRDKEVYESIFLTLKSAFYAVVFVCITGIPLAYLIARYDFWGKSILESLIDIPVMVPHTAAGIALLVAFNNGYIGEILSFFGIDFIDTTTGIISGMMFLSAPFLINGAKEGFKKVDVKYEHVARTLGANRFSIFFSIVLPNARNDILNGALMMWSRGLGEFGAVVIIAYHPMVAPVLIYDRFNNFGLNYSAPAAASMIFVSVCLFLSIRFINNRLNNKFNKKLNKE